MAELTITEMLGAKSLATEVVLLALLRERRDEVAFWNSLEKLMQAVLSVGNLSTHQDPLVRAQAEFAQDLLDTWRDIAGGDQSDPAPPGSGPFEAKSD
ncbi:hypothetical protein NG829_08380 [Xanthomonas sacchari]|uniref:hypothetical protein n=1 Tax=Xanthomonas sacchari TaxID=56458 RepID=UPI0022564BEE|nr:hypothetical protein [Xanthomonas sacchari]UYK72538.1 hypothetical protein NG828_20515 [Xanthomonas sacchari]UYK82292.1 hypothetical protein NG829_08380 [Xanthomonas sacchari]